MAAISIDGTPMTALPSDADQINYDNTSSGLQADDVQDAIDELTLEKKDEYTTITYAQWQAMTPTQQAAKDYYISNYPSSQIIAGNVSYSNTSSGMSANNVQGAVDELASEKKDEYTPITYAQWSVLTPAQKAAKDYYISDYPSSAITAGNVSYNNSSSGMSANNVQSAVDELKSGLTNLGTYESCTDAMQVESGVSIYGKTLYTNGKEIYGSVILDISQATSGVIANILTGYRPISRWTVSAMSYDDSLDGGITSIVIIQTNGDISIERKSNKPYLVFSFSYPIGN